MKKISIVFLGLLLMAASCGKQQVNSQNQNSGNQQATSTPDQAASWNTYKSPDKYGFSIQYPSDLGFDTNIEHVRSLAYIPVCDEGMVACVYISRDKYPGTNFDGAGVSVNIQNALDTEAKCYNFKVSTNAAQNQGADVVINGVSFKSATGGDAATGHFDKVQVYRNFHNNKCYELAAHVGSTNIGNYEPGTIKEFNQDEVWGKLIEVVNAFKFTNSASAAATQPAPAGQVTVTGMTVCLPHKNTEPGQPQTLECAIGLKEDGTGKYYALKNANPPFYDVNVKVRVTGMLQNDPSSIYNITGTIQVTDISKIQSINGGSGISGVAMLGPTCPVVHNPPSEQCSDKPYKTSLVVTTADQSQIVKTIQTGDDGKFTVDLPAGEYAIRSAAAANLYPYCSSSGTVTVAAGSFIDITVYCDTGIR